jgi:hypothetical protein
MGGTAMKRKAEPSVLQAPRKVVAVRDGQVILAKMGSAAGQPAVCEIRIGGDLLELELECGHRRFWPVGVCAIGEVHTCPTCLAALM